MSREECQKILSDIAALQPDSVIVVANIGGTLRIAYRYHSLQELVFNTKQLERTVDKVLTDAEITATATKQTNEAIERIKRGHNAGSSPPRDKTGGHGTEGTKPD